MTREQAIRELKIRFVGEYDRQREAKDMAIKALEQEPKRGRWELVQRGKCIDVCCSNCKAVRIKEYAYNYTIDQLDKEDVKECLESDDMRYCPYSGSDNRKVRNDKRR
jgi:heterodisulfide reductase subunit C